MLICRSSMDVAVLLMSVAMLPWMAIHDSKSEFIAIDVHKYLQFTSVYSHNT